jgi:hypothetical protein
LYFDILLSIPAQHKGIPSTQHPLYVVQQWCVIFRGGSRGGAPGARPPLKLEKIRFLGVKSWFFTRNTPQILAPPPNLKSWIRHWYLYNSYWYGGQYQDIQTAQGSLYGPSRSRRKYLFHGPYHDPGVLKFLLMLI